MIMRKCLFEIEPICNNMEEAESSEIVVDFGKICRLCLTDDGVLISLFAKDSPQDSANKSIPERIMDLMAIKVIKDDGFPSWICHNCLSQVDKCCEFFNMCRSSQAKLNESYITALSEAGVKVVTLKEGDTDDQFIDKEEISFVPPKETNEEEEQIEVKNYCSDCSKLFDSKDEFFIHRVSVHHDDLVTESGHTEQDSTNIWTCEPCGATFHKKSALVTHFQLKHPKTEKESPEQLKKLMFCKYCGLSFSWKNVSRHLHAVHKTPKIVDLDHGNVDCRICYRPFMRHSALRSHIEKFHGDNLEMVAEAENCEIVWNCGECDSAFLEEVHLVQHYSSKHSKHPFEVSALRGLKSKDLICQCGVICSNAFDMSLHEIFYHCEEDNSEYSCPACDRNFPKLQELKVHLVFHHSITSTSYDNECVFCNLAFDTNAFLKSHMNKDHSLESTEVKKVDEVETKEECMSFGCETCGAYFKTEEELRNHEKDCETSPNVCELCAKGFKTENQLKRHVSECHNLSTPIKCPLCPKVFPRKMNLHNHFKRRHLKQTKKFVCSYCGQALKGIVALQSHEDRLHRNIRSYKCSECPEAFTTRSILLKHAQRHLTERPMMQCKYCERKFSTISGIERHLKTHEGVKEFQCDLPICGKSFYTKSELKRHMKYHTRDFKHVCPVCNHKFMSPGELKKHSTKHTGERPFKCHLCSCAYSRRDDKVKHLKRVHNLRVKRVYGKQLRKSTDDDTELVDTIVIDESSLENAIVKAKPVRT